MCKGKTKKNVKKKVINLGFSASTGWSGTTSHLRYCFGTPHFHESSTHPSLNIRNCQAISDIQMIENIIMSSHAPQIDVNGLIVVYRFLALLIKWWCSGGNRTRTLQITGRRLSTHGHPFLAFLQWWSLLMIANTTLVYFLWCLFFRFEQRK